MTHQIDYIAFSKPGVSDAKHCADANYCFQVRTRRPFFVRSGNGQRGFGGFVQSVPGGWVARHWGNEHPWTPEPRANRQLAVADLLPGLASYGDVILAKWQAADREHHARLSAGAAERRLEDAAPLLLAVVRLLYASETRDAMTYDEAQQCRDAIMAATGERS